MIGQTIWKFDQNRRVYRKDKDGRSTGGPIYREHWRPVEITGENSRSWLLKWNGDKVPKKGPHPGYAFTAQEVDDDVWLQAHRIPISHAVMECNDVTKLRAIAELLEWTPREND